MTATGGTLGDTNQVVQTSIPLSTFQNSSVANTWIFVGYITNTVPNPTVTFTYASGQLDGTTQNRWYLDAVRFENVGDPCFGSGATQVGINGPLAAGQVFVNVTGVTAGATNVTVYANAVAIGQANNIAGFPAGQVTVTTTALVKDAPITATQKKIGCTSQAAGSGPLVGGGANPKVSAFLSCWKNSTNAGPVGANSSTPSSGFPYFLKASNFQVGFGTAPRPGQELLPDQCWQLLSFQNGIGGDDAIDSNGGAHVTNSDAYCSLEGLVFSIDDTDNGPYDIYVDQIMNGDTLVEDFESYTVGTTNTFVAPNSAANPIPSAAYLTTPNSSLISANYAYDGTKSCRIQWQWPDANNIRWAHVLANATTGKHYPQLDTTKPITLRVLLLPVGTTVAHSFNGTLSSITNSGIAYTGGTNTLGITVSGAGTYTYQWDFNGGLTTDATNATVKIGDPSGLTPSDSGIYSVAVNDGTCTEKRSYNLNVVDPIPTVTNQPAQSIVHAGSPASFSVGADGHVPAGYPLTYQWRTNGVDMTGEISPTLSIPDAQLANVGSYDVVVGNTYGSVTSAVATLDVVPVGIVIGNGTGLRGNYYSSHFSTNAFSGAPTLSRIDPSVNFDFGLGSPDPSISVDYFTARWAGQVQALGDDNYTFYTISDDGVRLWVNGQKIIDNWTLHAPTTNSAALSLVGVQKYDVFMEYFENAVSAVAKLYWSNAGGSVGFEAIPPSQLYPANTIPVQPALGVAQSDPTHLVFSWGPGQYSLVWATNVDGPYTNKILGATSPWTIVIGSETAKFFRLQVQ